MIAGRDRSIQLKISGFIEKDSQALIAISNKVERDGHSMFVIAVLTTLFLPGTFVAVRSQLSDDSEVNFTEHLADTANHANV